MASRNFETAAVIRLIDDLSGPMRALAREVGGLNKEFGRQMVRDHEQAAAQAGSHWTKFGQTIADAGKVAAAGLVAASKHALEAALHSARETDRTLARAHALDPNMTPKQYKEAQDFVNRNPELGRTTEEAAGALKAAEMQGVHDPKAQQALIRASRSYAIDNNLPMPEAVNEVAEHVNMRGELRNEAGKAISLGQASAEEIAKQVPMFMGQLAILGKHSSSNSHQIFDVMKYVGPLAKEGALGIPFEKLAGIIAQLGVVGIKGEEAGVAMKQLFARTLAPTNRGRFASNVMGVKFEDYATIDRERINPDNVISALGPKLGDLPDNTKNQLRHVMANLKSGISSFQEFQTQFTEALVSSGVKSMKNRASAGNVTRDISALMVKDIDITKLIELLHKQSSGPGFIAALNEIFGRQAGGRLASVNPEAFRQAGGIGDQMRADGDPAEFARKSVENFDSHLAPTMDRAQKALEGVGNEIIQQFEPALKKLLSTFLSGTQMFHGLTENTKSAIAYGGLALGTAVSVALAAVTGRIATNLYKGITAQGGPVVPPMTGAVAGEAAVAASGAAAGEAAIAGGMAASNVAAEASVVAQRSVLAGVSKLALGAVKFAGLAGAVFALYEQTKEVIDSTGRLFAAVKNMLHPNTPEAKAAKTEAVISFVDQREAALREKAAQETAAAAEARRGREYHRWDDTPEKVEQRRVMEDQREEKRLADVPEKYAAEFEQLQRLRLRTLNPAAGEQQDKADAVKKREDNERRETQRIDFETAGYGPKPVTGIQPPSRVVFPLVPPADMTPPNRVLFPLVPPTDRAPPNLTPPNRATLPVIPLADVAPPNRAALLRISPADMVPPKVPAPIEPAPFFSLKRMFDLFHTQEPGAVGARVLPEPAKQTPQEVRVQGSAELRTQVDVHLTGLDLAAGQLSRTVNGTTTINLGTSATGLQGVPYQPLTPPAAAPTSQPAVRLR